MVTFKVSGSGNFGDEIRKELIKQMELDLRKKGLGGVKVKIDARGNVTFSGSEADLKKVEALIPNWK